MGAHVDFDLSEYKAFFQKLERAAGGDFRRELSTFLEGLGNEFLRVLEDEIIRREVMDTRLLLNSFHKGSEGNVWTLDEGSLTLEVGTSVNYASYVNDGHWTNPKGVQARFIPGDVVLDSNGKVVDFTYNPSAKTGITLKQKWVPGKHYWESALRILEQMYPRLLDEKLQQWIDKYFS